jgi:hypothetical protein
MEVQIIRKIALYYKLYRPSRVSFPIVCNRYSDDHRFPFLQFNHLWDRRPQLQSPIVTRLYCNMAELYSHLASVRVPLYNARNA